MGQINITKTTLKGGAVTWTVHIVGMQDPSSLSKNPFNGNAAFDARNGGDTDVARAVREAMRQAGVGPDDPVMLVGHSLGGLTAANLAADSDFQSNYNVASVVSAGASVGDRKIPPPTTVLELVNPYDSIVHGTKRFGGSGSVGGKSNHFYVPADPIKLPGSERLERWSLLISGGNFISSMIVHHMLDMYEVLAEGWGDWHGSTNDVATWMELNKDFLCKADIESTEVFTYDSRLM